MENVVNMIILQNLVEGGLHPNCKAVSRPAGHQAYKRQNLAILETSPYWYGLKERTLRP